MKKGVSVVGGTYPMRMVSANGVQIPVLGQGSWYIGDIPQRVESEKAALRRGLELALNMIDTKKHP